MPFLPHHATPSEQSPAKTARTSLRAAFLAVSLLGLSACAATGTAEDNDPLEGFNRGVFAFNDAVDTVVLRPTAIVYREVMPDPFKDRIRDFLNNLKTPVILANDLLQGDLDRAETTFRRFFINTIAGLGGIIDVASSVGIQRHSEDFGQTLGTWGAGEGFYLVLPLLGPSSPRDTVGIVVDYFLDPVNYAIAAHGPREAGYARTGADVVDGRYRTLKLTDELRRDSVDYYAKVRSLYRQRREFEIRNGKGVPAPQGGEPAFPGQVINQ